MARLEFESKFLSMVSVPHGNGEWVYATRNKVIDGIVPKPKLDTVTIVPIIKTIKNDNISFETVLIESYRKPLQSREIGFAAGLVDDGETDAEAAKRELFEETGLELINTIHITPTLSVSSGMTDEMYRIVYAYAKGKETNENQEEDEDITVYRVNINEIYDFIKERHEKGVQISGRSYQSIQYLTGICTSLKLVYKEKPLSLKKEQFEKHFK